MKTRSLLLLLSATLIIAGCNASSPMPVSPSTISVHNASIKTDHRYTFTVRVYQLGDRVEGATVTLTLNDGSSYSDITNTQGTVTFAMPAKSGDDLSYVVSKVGYCSRSGTMSIGSGPKWNWLFVGCGT